MLIRTLHRITIAAVFAFAVNGPIASAQTAADKAEAGHYRALVNAAPLLPMERVELKINPTTTLGLISSVVAAPNGEIYILQRPADKKDDPIVVIDGNGNRLRSFGGGMFSTPHGIRIDPQGNVWTIDAHTSVVYKFTPQGQKLLQFTVGDIPDPKREFCGPTDMAFADTGHVYISDGYCNGRVLEYSADGKRLHVWGKDGKGPGQFHVAHDIVISPDHILYVADRENSRLQWFTMDGRYLGEKEFFGQVFSVAQAANGDMFVGVRARGVPLDQGSTIFKFDPKSGKIEGRVEGFAHQLGIGPDGALYPGTTTVRIGSGPPMQAILVYRRAGK